MSALCGDVVNDVENFIREEVFLDGDSYPQNGDEYAKYGNQIVSTGEPSEALLGVPLSSLYVINAWNDVAYASPQ